jgi:protein tyrosine phosphatase (PTP) superfamily phosphohydrolase (DUF442 family)
VETLDEPELTAIFNYRRLSERLATSGQPGEAELGAIARAGFEVVINLALHDCEGAPPDERRTVEGLGMTYEHIPVVWQHPAPADLEAFFSAMDRHAGRAVYVHCAANLRVSAFMLLYRVIRLGWRLEDALPDLQAIWQPDDTWQAFIDAALAG